MTWTLGMPNLGHTMEEGKVQEWLKAVGDPVRAGEVIAVVESDKSSFDVEAPADGVLLAIVAVAGETVPVGGVIGHVGRPGETPPMDSGTAAAATAAEAQPAQPTAAAQPVDAPATGRVRATPAARALAEALGVDLGRVRGTGDEGMVTRDDVREAASASPAAAAPVADAGAGRAAQPLSPMRRAIADATQRAWAAIPHVALRSRADVGGLQQLGLPLTAAVARACAIALGRHGELNGWLHDAGFEPAAAVHLGVAVSTDTGLVTAVLRDAQGKSAAALRQEIQEAAALAREGRLPGARTLGASFTISSLGRWGVDEFAPIIAAPQVAILGIGRLQRNAREAADGGLRFASELPLTLVFDHRANDGVAAARLLADIVALLEQPQGLEAA